MTSPYGCTRSRGDARRSGADSRRSGGLLRAAVRCRLCAAPAERALSRRHEHDCREYVKLVLALGQHDAAYVDAYYGPPDGRPRPNSASGRSPKSTRARRLIEARGRRVPARSRDDLTSCGTYLASSSSRCARESRMLSGARLTFDEESHALYDAVAPTAPNRSFQATLDELEKLLPGARSLIERYDAFPSSSHPARPAVARVRCGHRGVPGANLAHAELPAGESFTVEYVTNKSWSGYNWYQGGYRSLIQVNIDLPIYIDRAIDLACHEGYPGHHVYNALLEKNLMRDRGWLESPSTRCSRRSR